MAGDRNACFCPEIRDYKRAQAGRHDLCFAQRAVFSIRDRKMQDDMMRRDGLMRAKRFRVEDIKRRMATLDSMREDAERKLADLDVSIARERQRANDSDLGRLAFPSFLRSIDSRCENLRATLKDIEREFSQCESDLALAHQELKSLEIAVEQQARRTGADDMRRGSSRLQDLAMARHLRKHALPQA
jgi:chromosome segregation ATPase